MVLAVVVPAVFIAGLLARPSVPTSGSGSRALPAGAVIVKSFDQSWQKNLIHTRIYRLPDDTSKLRLQLEPSSEIPEPDLLVYWSDKQSSPAPDSLAPDAQFLGDLAQQTYVLPSGSERGGLLILYSLGHQRVVDRAKLEALR